MSAQSLQAHMLDADFLDDDERDHYRIGAHGHPLNEAAWAMKKLAHYRGLQDQARSTAQTEIAHINQWLTAEVDRHERDASYFEGLLIRFHQDQMSEALDAAGGDWSKVEGKSRHLPDGLIVARKAPTRVDVDLDAFLAWGPPDELVRTKTEPDKKAILAHAATTGEIPGGVEIVDGEITFSVAPEATA